MQLWRYGQPIESLNGERYILEGMLGSGGMAEVWKAYDEDEMRDVAIKILKPEFSDQETMNRFVKEAGQIVGWQHPHILKIYDHMQIEKFDANHFLFYIIMEYAKGGDLQHRLTPGKPYPLRATFTIVRQLCDAIAYAHRHGVIHRDLKPPNVLFRQPRTGPEEVVLSDFGLAVQVDASHHTFAQGGTLAYMAPEQFQGQSQPASDIFALGVILYQLCTGEMPFRRSLQDFSFLEIERETQPPSPSTINPSLPSILDSVILCALEPEPTDRYRSAEEFWKTIALALQKSILPSEQRSSRLSQPSTQQLTKRTSNMPPEKATRPGQKGNPQTIQLAQSDRDNFAEKETITPRRSSQGNLPFAQSAREEKPQRISRRLLIGAGAGASVIAVVGGGTLLFSHLMTPTSKIQATSTTSRGLHSPLPTSTTPTTSPSPTQTHSATPISVATPTYTYKGHKSTISSLSWSPNGTQIVSSEFGDGAAILPTVQVWDATTGQHRLVVYTEQDGAFIYSVSWSPTGTMVAWGEGDNNARFWTASTGQINTYLVGVVATAVSWSPNGTLIAIGLYDGTIKVLNPSTGGNTFFLRGHKDEVTSVEWSPDGSKIASSSLDHTVRIWNASNGQPLFTYTGHSAPVNSISWSPNGAQLASVNAPPINGPISPSNVGTVHVWNATTGLGTLVHHTMGGSSVSWSSTQPQWIACDNYDITSSHFMIDIWDATTGKTAATWDVGPSTQLNCVAWSPKSGLLASGGGDATIQVWSPFQ